MFFPRRKVSPPLQRALDGGAAVGNNSGNLESTPAILLRKTRLSETSLILTWLTERHGRLKTVAKGARQPKSKFAGQLDLFFLSEIQFVRSRKSELHTLRDASLLNAHEGLRTDLQRVALAAYFVELLEMVTEPDHEVRELYDLLLRALGHLHQNPASVRALEHFERELVRLLGIEHPDISPAHALRRVYHRLPPTRAEILKPLQQTPPA